MKWTKPDYQEISLGMEVTAYVNTDEPAGAGEPARAEPAATPEQGGEPAVGGGGTAG